jgi:dienelactone hydrolase
MVPVSATALQFLELAPAFFTLVASLVTIRVKKWRRAARFARARRGRAELDPTEYLDTRYRTAARKLAFRCRTSEETEAWQRKLRDKLRELLGGFAEPAPAVEARIIETRFFDTKTCRDMRLDTIVFQTRHALNALATLLVPAGSARLAPVAVCVPGHGRGVADILGWDGDAPRGGPADRGRFALRLAELGVAVLAIEPLGFGQRRDALTRAKGAGHSACVPLAGGALLLGQTMLGWRVWEIMRAIDWLQTRRDVDAERVACVGFSGGATCALFAAALDTRIRVALVSGYLSTFRESLMRHPHCIDNYVPGILNWCEMHDVAGLVAPRPLFVESGDADLTFPVEAARRSVAETRRVYQSVHAAENIEHEVFTGGHVFWGERGLPFVCERLSRAQGRRLHLAYTTAA